MPPLEPVAGLGVRGVRGGEGWEHPKRFLYVVHGAVRRAGGPKLLQKVTHE